MEYAGAGSFWSQLAGNQEDPLAGSFAPRKIDELLRNPNSSLLDILSDEEAISEFRSGNQKMVSRVTESAGINIVMNLILSRDLPEGITSSQRLQLPYIATELVACEVDGLLDAFTREVPGMRGPLDRLFDLLIEGSETNPTVLGYVVRVLLVLVNRRVSVIDKYIEAHHAVISEALIDLLRDKSVADLLFRLCLDEDIKSFRLDFNRLISTLSEESADNVVWLMESMFARPLLGNNEKVVAVFHQIREALTVKEGLDILLNRAFSESNAIVSGAAFEIMSILVQYSYTRPVETGTVTPMDPGAGWESFTPAQPSSGVAAAASKPIDDDDNCLFDDEEEPVSVSTLDPYVAFGQALTSACLSKAQSFSAPLGDIQHLHSFLKLFSRCLKYSGSPFPGVVMAATVVAAMTQFPRSTGIHNLCRDCLLGSNLSQGEVESFASIFVPKSKDLLTLPSANSHVGRMLYFLQSKGVPIGDETCRTAAAKWKQTDTRLADREKAPSRVPSPQGVTPIIDLEPVTSDQWADIPPVFAGSLSPQVRFPEENPPSTLTELSSSTDSWTSGQLGMVDESSP